MIAEAIEYRDDIAIESVKIIDALKRYPQLFNEETATHENFVSFYA